VPGWSLDTLVQSLEEPAAESPATAQGLSLAEIEAIAAERLRQQEQQAAEARARARAQAEARAREQAEVQARERAAAEAERRAEQERLRRHPARVWFQIATGADPSALAFDCRRLQRQYTQAFGSQTCSTAVWNRTRRLLVGPFRNAAAAREWGVAYARAGGNAGFVWNSDAGEEVTPVGRR
jgi:DNA-binding transcriptional MerR regulator